MLFDRIVRPTLYRLNRLDAETVHERTVRVLARMSAAGPLTTALRRYYRIDDPCTVFGIRFPNRLGLAAGMDKDGRALNAWSALGFGFVEVGTVTRHAQPGNPKPRLFTLEASDAVLNRMGFNNAGAAALARRLATTGTPDVPIGISIGKSKVTPVENAISDYRESLVTLYPHADYVAVNVSSPNTPGLRSLQDRGALTELLAELSRTSRDLAAASGRGPVPLLVKVAPDLTFDAIAELLDVCLEHEVAGVIATNTTLSRDGLAPEDARFVSEQGGLSGRPLAARSVEVVRFVHDQAGDTLPIIGVGGIGGPDDALRMLDAGASLLQLYSAFALHGPGVVRRINSRLARRRVVPR
ncbi:quinone-dependent dihydroorotate dehydrogenase [Saccharomonospora xinjiangensis]|uniref:Dihydroorotate dehydrogenase (quinone) n=1 Tax=Saccharomonospora xinjiangensis XJ-54 TaxID=882086 RepID=I0V6W0_9PSEU|nr:quinone-dependent dihydroorotate dehydrogenase [Saccharomonospora xinjiangensis]EID55863.1 dihydroorotate dehydrogenase, subfamily 2 [Saccharomonospora xinjiangensis XJ-54]